jgi:hypothetical protein
MMRAVLVEVRNISTATVIAASIIIFKKVAFHVITCVNDVNCLTEQTRAPFGRNLKLMQDKSFKDD